MTDVVQRANAALKEPYRKHRLAELVPELVAEIERLRRHRCNPPGGIDLVEIS